MNYFINCKTLDDVKKLYKKLALENHPDRGGKHETMQQINSQYADAIRIISNGMEFEKEEQQIAEDFQKIINELINLDGLIIDIVGNWIWVYGDTKTHKDIIKNVGLWWAKKKKKWYYRPANFKSSNRKPKSYEQITAKYGRKTVKSNKTNSTNFLKYA